MPLLPEGVKYQKLIEAQDTAHLAFLYHESDKIQVGFPTRKHQYNVSIRALLI